jgi:uncharacterized membrane protein
MSMAQSLISGTRGAGARWLLLGSLALNLFFIGVAVAMCLNAPARTSRWDPNVFVRVERMAAALPQADGDILRGEMRARQDAIAAAQTKYHDARNAIRETLRQEPFKADDMNAAMAATRAARMAFDGALAGAMSEAATKMSAQGRQALADWRPSRRSTGKRQ